MSFQWAFLHLINMSLSAKHPPPHLPPPPPRAHRALRPRSKPSICFIRSVEKGECVKRTKSFLLYTSAPYSVE
jgi:hypothetical protein